MSEAIERALAAIQEKGCGWQRGGEPMTTTRVASVDDLSITTVTIEAKCPTCGYGAVARTMNGASVTLDLTHQCSDGKLTRFDQHGARWTLQ